MNVDLFGPGKVDQATAETIVIVFFLSFVLVD